MLAGEGSGGEVGGVTRRRSRKIRPARGRAALKSAATTIDYECWMLAEAYSARLSASALATASFSIVAQHNMAVESFLLHTRCLQEFFRESGGEDDILASDFLVYGPRFPLPTVASKPFRSRVNKRLAHASYKRPRLRRSWDDRDIVRDVAGAFDKFLARFDADHPRRRTWFQDARQLVRDAKARGLL